MQNERDMEGYGPRGPVHITESAYVKENLKLAFLVQELEKELNKYIKDEDICIIKNNAEVLYKVATERKKK